MKNNVSGEIIDDVINQANEFNLNYIKKQI